MAQFSLPVLLAVHMESQKAFDKALKDDKLSEISTNDNFIEDFNYVGVNQEGEHMFQHTKLNHIVKCKA